MVTSFLITNDDGIDAPGIRALYQALSQVTNNRIVIVAPKHHQSGCGHRVNIRTVIPCLLYTSPSPRDRTRSRMPSSA